MTGPDVAREAVAVALGVVIGPLVALAAGGLLDGLAWAVLALVVVPVAICAVVLRPRTSRGIVPAVSVTVVLEAIAIAVLLEATGGVSG